MHLNPLKIWPNHPICYNCASLQSSQGNTFWVGWWSQQKPVWINHRSFLFFTLWGHAVRNKHCTFVPAAGTGLTTWRGAGLHGILLHTLHKFIRFRTYSENLLGWRAEGVNWRYKNARLSGYIGLESIKSIGHCTLETISKYFKHHHPQQIASLTIFDSLRFRFGQELLSLQLRDSEPVISATKGRIFFFRRSVGQWFSFSSTTSEEELLGGGCNMFFWKFLHLKIGEDFQFDFAAYLFSPGLVSFNHQNQVIAGIGVGSQRISVQVRELRRESASRSTVLSWVPWWMVPKGWLWGRSMGLEANNVIHMGTLPQIHPNTLTMCEYI